MRLSDPSMPTRLSPIELDACHAGRVSIMTEITDTFAAITIITPDARLPLFAHEARLLVDALNRLAIHVELEVARD